MMSVDKLSKVQKEVLQTEHEIFAAIKNKDAKFLNGILAEDFLYRSPGKPDITKSEFVKIATTFPAKILAVWSNDLKVNVYANTAVITGVQLSKVQIENREIVSSVMFTDIFVNREKKWVLVLAHTMELPESPDQSR
jgi:hypothetical protein